MLLQDMTVMIAGERRMNETSTPIKDSLTQSRADFWQVAPKSPQSKGLPSRGGR